jgi:uncharacterized membrane protein YgcG
MYASMHLGMHVCMYQYVLEKRIYVHRINRPAGQLLLRGGAIFDNNLYFWQALPAVEFFCGTKRHSGGGAGQRRHGHAQHEHQRGVPAGGGSGGGGAAGVRESCSLVLNTVTSTPQWIR